MSSFSKNVTFPPELFVTLGTLPRGSFDIREDLLVSGFFVKKRAHTNNPRAIKEDLMDNKSDSNKKPGQGPVKDTSVDRLFVSDSPRS